MTGSKETVAATDAAIRRLAYRGRGILTARAAAAAGIHPEALFHASKRGTIHPTGYRGVYSVFPPGSSSPPETGCRRRGSRSTSPHHRGNGCTRSRTSSAPRSSTS